jgi:hypothetical protein
MTSQEILQNIPSELFDENGNTPITKILVRNNDVSVLPEPYLTRDGDEVYNYTKNNGFVELDKIDISGYQKEYVTAEEWITSQGYTPIRIVTLMDLENKLNLANKTSQKVLEVRQWLDTILAVYVINSSANNSWPAAPHTFEQTVLDGYTTLST